MNQTDKMAQENGVIQLSKSCFIISPIGEENSEIRARADEVLEFIIMPVVREQLHYDVKRSDMIANPGLITNQVIQHIANDDLVIADLTGHNPNVYYELAIRHAVRKPLVQIILKGEVLPFDVKVMRTIQYDLTLPGVKAAKATLLGQIEAIEARPEFVDSPLSVAIDLISLKASSNPEEKTIARIISGFSDMRNNLSSIESKLANPQDLFPPSHFASILANVFDKYKFSQSSRISDTLAGELLRSSIKMVYAKREKGLEAMTTAIDEADEFIFIMGVSLREFFLVETSCRTALLEKHRNSKNMKFRFLILDNNSDEAVFRAGREEGVKFSGANDQNYLKKTLFTETSSTESFVHKHYDKSLLRKYDRLSLFLLLTEKVAFMEPYHYGERRMEKEDIPIGFKRVAELVPLIEFEKSSERGPYHQLLGHFEFIYSNAGSQYS
jgi:hypothetical protein